MHPILFSFGPVRLYSYGFLVALGVVSAIAYLRKQSAGIGVEPARVMDLALLAVVSGFVGARVFYVIQEWDYFIASPHQILQLWEGGIVFYGGLLGGFLGFAAFVWAKRLSLLAMLDLFVPAVALAQGFGRIGCFLNGCCYGIPAHVPWSVQFPFLADRVHPVQLYEALFCWILAAVLFVLWSKRLRAGTVTGAYFILYPVGRFFFEFLRGDHAGLIWNLTLHQWVSLLVAAVGLVVLKQALPHGNQTAPRSF